MNSFLLNKFNKTKPSVLKANETTDFCIHKGSKQWGFVVCWESKDVEDEIGDFKELIKGLPMTNIRGNQICFEGTANDIARLLGLNSTHTMRCLRTIRDSANPVVFYSRTSEIEPTVKTGGVFYWRVILGEHQPTTKTKISFKKKTK